MEMISKRVKLRPFNRYFFEYAGGSVGRGKVRVRMHANLGTAKSMPSGAELFKGGPLSGTCHRENWSGLWKVYDRSQEYAKARDWIYRRPQ